MEEKANKGIKLLLENFWITRTKNREEYYEIKDNRSEIEKFFVERAGWKIDFTNQLIRLKKIPANAETFMGIIEFKEIMDYCILCGLLMILEDKEDMEQFLLSDLTSKIKIYLKDYIEIDWLNYSHRRSLVRAFEFAEKIGLIIKNDGNIKNYNDDKEVEVLYEKTGLSRYFVIDFEKDISEYTSYKDFEIEKNENIDIDRGEYRKNRVYRKLLCTPAVYWNDLNEADSIYIRNQKPALEASFNKYIDGNLHIHKNSAFIGFDENIEIGEIHPKKTMLSEIVLLLCGEIRKKIVNNKIKRELKDFIYLSDEDLIKTIEECRNLYGINWSKEYREMKIEKIYENIIEYMEEWKFGEKINDEQIVIYPAVGKVIGRYRKSIRGGINEE